MSKTIVLKTDASYKEGVGAGLSFICKVLDGGVKINEITGSMFTKSIKNSTHAETVATIFGIKNIVDKVDSIEDYQLTIGSDCEYTVRALTDSQVSVDDRLLKTAHHLLSVFNTWRIRWIPRTKNSTADALARSALMNYEDGYIVT